MFDFAKALTYLRRITLALERIAEALEEKRDGEG